MKLTPTNCCRLCSVIPVIVRLPMLPWKHSMYEALPRDFSYSQLPWISSNSPSRAGWSSGRRRRNFNDLIALASLPFLMRNLGVCDIDQRTTSLCLFGF